MSPLVRLGALLWAVTAAVVPVVALAQGVGGGEPVPEVRNFGWLWIIAAALVVVALFRMFFGRRGRTSPSRP